MKRGVLVRGSSFGERRYSSKFCPCICHWKLLWASMTQWVSIKKLFSWSRHVRSRWMNRYPSFLIRSSWSQNTLEAVGKRSFTRDSNIDTRTELKSDFETTLKKKKQTYPTCYTHPWSSSPPPWTPPSALAEALDRGLRMPFCLIFCCSNVSVNGRMRGVYAEFLETWQWLRVFDLSTLRSLLICSGVCWIPVTASDRLLLQGTPAHVRLGVIEWNIA